MDQDQKDKDQAILKKSITLATALGVFSLTLIGLKLTSVITWNWAWVLLPVWGFPALYLLGIVAVGLMFFALTVSALLFGDREPDPKFFPKNEPIH